MSANSDFGTWGRYKEIPLDKMTPNQKRRSKQIGLDHDEETDYGLLTRIAAQDRRALRKFFPRHQARVCSFLRRIRRSREPVEELVIDTFAVVWREAHTFPRESRVSIWLLGIAYRLMLASLRNELAGSDGPVEADFDGDDSEKTSRPAWLSQALMRLSFRERAVVELVYGLGLSCDEIASVLQCSMEAVKAGLLQAREKLDSSRPTGARFAR
jgi:RNA polymerase sigma-70 factor (ECF subfamily)